MFLLVDQDKRMLEEPRRYPHKLFEKTSEIIAQLFLLHPLIKMKMLAIEK